MTVASDTPSFIQIPGNGTATSFAFPFKIFQASDLVVGFITSSGYTQQTSGFTVQNVDVNGGGNVGFTTAPPSGTTVDIRSVTPKIQNTEFANLGAFLPEAHTEAFDRLTRTVQDLYRLAYTFGIHGPDQEGTAWTALPVASQRKNNALMFDSNGLPTVGTLVSQALTQSLIGQFLYPQTAAEIAAGVTPTNYAYAPGVVDRYGTNTTPGTTVMDTAFTAAAAQNAQGGPPVTLLASTYIITGVTFLYNNAGIVGPGSKNCIIRQNPAGFSAGGGVVSVGVINNGTTHYSGFYARGFTIDGNRANIASPADDLHGHGMPISNISNFNILDVEAINCWNAGIGLFLNNQATGNTETYSYVQGRCYNCGNATYTPPGFDINASRQIIVDVTTESCNAGARLLNNCSDIQGRLGVYTPTNQGVILQNTSASGNRIFNCTLDIVVNGSGNQGLLMQEGVTGNHIRARIYKSGGVGCQLVAGSSSSANCDDNHLFIQTEQSQQQGLLSGGADRNYLIHISKLDGRSGAAGSYYALDWTGNNSVLNSTIDGDGQVRSFAIRAGSTTNKVISAQATNCLSGYTDAGTGTSLVPVTFEATISGTFNLTSGAAPTVVTGAVPGVAFGDQVQVAWPSNQQGVLVNGYVSAAGTVAVAAYNITGAALNFGAITVTVRITKSAANQVL